jgi:WD40 repeat protein
MTLEGHAGAIVKATLSPDDQMIATAGEDGTVKLWPILFETRNHPSIRSALEGRMPWRWEAGELQPKIKP